MISAGAVFGLLLLACTLLMLFVGLPYTKPPKRSCCCGLIDLGTAHFYVERGGARIHEPDRCGPAVEWIHP